MLIFVGIFTFVPVLTWSNSASPTITKKYPNYVDSCLSSFFCWCGNLVQMKRTQKIDQWLVSSISRIFSNNFDSALKTSLFETRVSGDIASLRELQNLKHLRFMQSNITNNEKSLKLFKHLIRSSYYI